MNALLCVALIVMVVWRSRHLPLAGWRKRAAVGARVVAIGALCAALLGFSRHHQQIVPRRVVYLADGSASIDPAQRAWMARRIASLESVRPARMERALMVFGREAVTIVEAGREPLRDPERILQRLQQAPLQRDQTNVEAALLSALPMFPPGHRGSVILLSDGRETAGDLTGLLAHLRRLGLQVFPVPPPSSGVLKTAWDALIVPPVVQRGSSVPLHLLLVNSAQHPINASITVRLHDVAIKERYLLVRPGWQALTVSVPAVARGTLPLDVEVTIPDQGLSQRRRAYTQVEGPPRLLFVSEQPATLPPLAAALKRREIEIAMARLSDLPAHTDGLLEYDAVVLFNIPKSSIAPAQAEALRGYIEGFAGGLIMVGLGGDLSAQTTQSAPVDALLPIVFEPKGLQEAKRRVCFVMLIDRSASMLGPRIAATKRAAVSLVKQLSPEDLVGILAFDTQPYVVAEVQPAGQIGPALVEKLVKLRSSGGTDVYPAMTAAVNRLELTGATLKHIILLTDGQTPYHEKAYAALIQSLKLSGTTVSTIGIGSAFVNEEFLQWLARSTGGTYYPLRSLEELPKLLARDTQQELGRLPFAEGYVRASKTPTTDWFPDIERWPAVRGYLTATARPTARVDVALETTSESASQPTREPLLARWSLGRGRVVSLTSDADARWMPEWVRWEHFEGVWAHIVRWTMRPRLAEDLFVRVEEASDRPRLIVEGELHDPRGLLVAASGEARYPVSLVQSGTWRWEAALDQVPGGWYQLTLESRGPAAQGAAQANHLSDDAQASVFATRWIQLGAPPTAGEVAGLPPDEAALQQVARATSGAYDMPDRAFFPATTTVPVSLPLFRWWLPLALLALLIDIAARGSTML